MFMSVVEQNKNILNKDRLYHDKVIEEERLQGLETIKSNLLNMGFGKNFEP